MVRVITRATGRLVAAAKSTQKRNDSSHVNWICLQPCNERQWSAFQPLSSVSADREARRLWKLQRVTHTSGSLRLASAKCALPISTVVDGGLHRFCRTLAGIRLLPNHVTVRWTIVEEQYPSQEEGSIVKRCRNHDIETGPEDEGNATGTSMQGLTEQGYLFVETSTLA